MPRLCTAQIMLNRFSKGWARNQVGLKVNLSEVQTMPIGQSLNFWIEYTHFLILCFSIYFLWWYSDDWGWGQHIEACRLFKMKPILLLKLVSTYIVTYLLYFQKKINYNDTCSINRVICFLDPIKVNLLK